MRLYKRLLLGACGLLFLASVVMRVHSIAVDVPTLTRLESLPVIVIDPGHGGLDGGAVSDDGSIVEKDINLAIALTLRDLLVSSGFEVVMTRETDISIHDEGVTGTKNQKTSDLHNRLALGAETPNTVFISVHQNKFGQSSSRGTQVFYGPRAPQSQQLAGILQKNFVAMVQPENGRQIKEAQKNLYLMYEADWPAVLVECGFLSNPEESVKLAAGEYQAQLAFVIYSSVLEYVTAPPPSQEPVGAGVV